MAHLPVLLLVSVCLCAALGAPAVPPRKATFATGPFSSPAMMRLNCSTLPAPSPSFYHNFNVLDSALPKVKMHLASDPWITWVNKNSFNDCTSYCEWIGSSHGADGVVFSLPTMGGIPTRSHDNQLYISLALEADDSGIGKLRGMHEQFDLHSNFALESDIPALYNLPSEEELLRPPPPKTAKKLAAWLSSRCVEPRNSFVGELMRYMPIDAFGKCHNNARLPQGMNDESFFKFLGQYKFIISVENSLENGYVTEKFWKGFQAGSVPVYIGDESVNRELLAPGAHSFIFGDDFPSARALAEYLVMLDKNDHLYQRYFDWKKEPFRAEFQAYLQLDWNTLACRMCRRVAVMKHLGHTRTDLVRLKEEAKQRRAEQAKKKAEAMALTQK
jgi:hypothetical protein